MENIFFKKKFNNLRKDPKLVRYLLLFVIISFVSSIISFQLVDFESIIGSLESYEDMEVIVLSTKFFMVIMYALTAFFSTIVYFFGFLILSKILNTSVRYLSIFSAVVLMNLYTGIVGLMGLIIHFLFSIPLDEYNILSLDILNNNSTFLSAINLSLATQTYCIYLILYFTMKISKKVSLILTCIYAIFNLFINLI